jgi:hypothetical protein
MQTPRPASCSCSLAPPAHSGQEGTEPSTAPVHRDTAKQLAQRKDMIRSLPCRYARQELNLHKNKHDQDAHRRGSTLLLCRG